VTIHPTLVGNINISTQPPRSIGEAIESFTEADFEDAVDESLEDKTGTETASETDDTILEEGVSEEDQEQELAGEGEGEQETESDTESEEEAEEHAAPEVDEEDEWGDLTPDDLSEIRSDPRLDRLRKGLMRGYNKKIQDHEQLVQLGERYIEDPVGVLEAIARANGYTVAKAAAAAAAAEGAPETTEERIENASAEAGKELEGLFGVEHGPKVRAIFDKYVRALVGDDINPIKQTVGKLADQSRIAAFQTEEAAFRARHEDLTDAEIAAVVELGNSGRIVPGQKMPPSEYLETLLRVVRAESTAKAAKEADSRAAKNLAKKVQKNRADREPRGRSGRGGTVKPVSKLIEDPASFRNLSEAIDYAGKELDSE